jgi:hypothetical protein
MHRRCHPLRERTQDSADSEALKEPCGACCWLALNGRRPFDAYVELLKIRYSEISSTRLIINWFGLRIAVTAARRSTVSQSAALGRLSPAEFRFAPVIRGELDRPDRRIPVRVFLIEDEVHRILRRFKRRRAPSSISWLVFSSFWSSSAIV